ncbi:unnamed protein product [Adineta ricciae]|uniref:Uncharacterized protein n=1 Tax=Adineta ricciae TaxID=249248 RepID=A0A815VG62_ADIRI|nr:unnamed protein product [Adineta ricciae]CAF1650866.1 unnamed protein product [Adineta ricciae]
MFYILKYCLIYILFGTADSFSNYDKTVLEYSPVVYWSLDPQNPNDYSNHNLNGAFTNNPSNTTMPNGDIVCVFNGLDQYYTIEENDYLEIARTGILTIVAWLRPDTLQFEHSEGSGYVWWMGKGETSRQSWAARMYNYQNQESRPNRISGYAFNASGGLGAGSYFQDTVIVGEWILYTLVINTVNVSNAYPTGYIKIFKNGIQRDQDALISYNVVPTKGTAPMRIGTRDQQSFFKGAIGKVALFDYELNSSQLQNFYNCMKDTNKCSMTNNSRKVKHDYGTLIVILLSVCMNLGIIL